MPRKNKAKKQIPKAVTATEKIQSSIYSIRGENVMLDSDLAELYGVETGALNRAVKRNMDRFPESFMFQLDPDEWESLKCQAGISKGRGGRRYAPYVFTEHGAVMLASVLNSRVAIRTSIQVIKVFVRLRKILASNAVLADKVEQLEKKLNFHDKAIGVLFAEIRQLVEKPEPEPQKGRIGFKVPKR